MPHIAPKSAEDLRDVKKVLEMSEAAMGFIPNSTLTMAHKPQLSLAFSLLAAVTYGADLKGLLAFYGDAIPEPSNPEQSLTPEQIQLLAFAVSLSAGCRYCQAHTSHRLVEAGANQEKLSAIADYEASAAYPWGKSASGPGLCRRTESQRSDLSALHCTERSLFRGANRSSGWGRLALRLSQSLE